MSSTDNDRVSRRRFLQSVGVAGVVGAGSSLLAACGGGSSDSESSSGSGGASESSSDGGTKTASADCSDVSDLSDAKKKQRSQMVESLQYVEETPNAEKNCANCSLYIEGDYGEGCGGCQLFPGAVAANGYCNSWAPAS
jgi:hypothetical protein